MDRADPADAAARVGLSKNPILKPLDQISCRDAVVNPEDATESEWPEADCIVGKLRQLYEGGVPGGADLVTFWFARAWQQIAAGKTGRAGLAPTNSIRGGHQITLTTASTRWN
jgi:hypothetical protein